MATASSSIDSWRSELAEVANGSVQHDDLDTALANFMLSKDSVQSTRLSHVKDFKPRGPSDQERRRKELLERQKKARASVMSIARRLAEEEEDEEDLSALTNVDTAIDESANPTSIVPIQNEEESMELDERPSKRTPTRRQAYLRKKRDEMFRDQLMIAEYLTEIPQDLCGSWYAIPCPHGKRCIVISARGNTTARLRSGAIWNRFPSRLPGGSRDMLRKYGSRGSRSQAGSGGQAYCVLDCIFHEPSRTYYVLDMMAWRGYDLYHCTTEFRFFWRTTKLAEADEDLSIFSDTNNPFRFIPLPFFECDVASLRAALSEASLGFPRDVMAFYHKQTVYTPGVTPLVAYLPTDQVTTTLSPYYTALGVAGLAVPAGVPMTPPIGIGVVDTTPPRTNEADGDDRL